MIKQELLSISETELRTAKIRLRPDGIMEFHMKESDDLTVKDLKELNSATALLGQGKAYPNLFYVNYFINISGEARAYGASEESNRYTLADAFVMNSEALKLIRNFYIRFNKPVRPTRMFTSDTEAVQWLKSFI